MSDRDRSVADLETIIADVDRRVGELTDRHAARLHCRLGCTECCVDGIRVFEVEAERIRRRYERLLETGTPHPEGACAFLDESGACRIYPVRPYVCRTQGLPLSWIEEVRGAAPTELRDICPLNEAGAPIDSLDSDACWRIGPFEGRLARLQARLDGGQMRRVRLRDLFAGRVKPPSNPHRRRSSDR